MKPEPLSKPAPLFNAEMRRAREAAELILRQFVVRHAAYTGRTKAETIQDVIQRAIDAALNAERAEISRQIAELDAYAVHSGGCALNTAPVSEMSATKCTCGLDAARKELGI